MKYFLILSLIMGSCWLLPAQRPVIDRLKDRVKQQTTQRAEQRADQVIDKGLDKLEEAVFGARDSASSQSEESQNRSQNPESQNEENIPLEIEKPSETEPNISPTGRQQIPQGEVEAFPEVEYGNEALSQGTTGKGPYGVHSGRLIQITRSQSLKSVQIEQHDTLFFTDYGVQSFRAKFQTQHINMMGISQTQNNYTHALALGDTLYSIDPMAGTGIKMGNPAKAIFEGMSEKEMEQFGEQLTEDMNTEAKRLGTQRIAGKVCEVMEFRTYGEAGELLFISQIWFYKGIVLQSRSRGLGSEIEVTTTLFDENPNIPAQIFQLDPDISFSAYSLPFGY